MKVKAKEKNGIVQAKVLIKHQNIGPEEAEKKKKEPNFRYYCYCKGWR